MGHLADVMRQWAFQTWQEPDYTVSQDGKSATLRFERLHGDVRYQAWYKVFEDQNRVELLLYAPFTVPEAKRPAAAEAIARALRSTAILGRIELDMVDGELRFRGGMGMDCGELSGKMLDNLLADGNSLLDRYLPAIESVVFDDAAPEDAIGEASLEPPPPEDEKEPLPWDHFPGSACLQAWARELVTACQAKDSAIWDLTGRTVVVISDKMGSWCSPVLHRVAIDAGMRFISMRFWEPLPPPEAFRRHAPVLVYREPDRWLLNPPHDEDPKETESWKRSQASFAERLREFDLEKPVVYATSAVRIPHIDESLRRSRLFDRFLTLPGPSMDTEGRGIIERIGRERCSDSLTLCAGKVGKLFSEEYREVRRTELAVLRLRRLAAHEGRPLEFVDLVNVAMRGFAEADSPVAESEQVRRQVAYHEAGHAAVAVLDSGGKNIPEYSSIVPSANFKGLVVQSYQFHIELADRETYQSFRHSVRISLAGRVAEDLVFGPDLVSNGAWADLKAATSRAVRAFAHWGFSPSMGADDQAASNLAVVVDKPTTAQTEYVEGLVRDFLAAEYRVVKSLLSDHRTFLDAIAERLMWDPVVDQEALGQLWKEHLSAVS